MTSNLLIKGEAESLLESEEHGNGIRSLKRVKVIWKVIIKVIWNTEKWVGKGNMIRLLERSKDSFGVDSQGFEVRPVIIVLFCLAH